MSFIHILYLIRTYMQMIKSSGKYYFSYRKFWKFYIYRICETGAFIKCISLCSYFSASIKIYDQSLSVDVQKTHVLLLSSAKTALITGSISKTAKILDVKTDPIPTTKSKFNAG